MGSMWSEIHPELSVLIPKMVYHFWPGVLLHIAKRGLILLPLVHQFYMYQYLDGHSSWYIVPVSIIVVAFHSTSTHLSGLCFSCGVGYDYIMHTWFGFVVLLAQRPVSFRFAVIQLWFSTSRYHLYSCYPYYLSTISGWHHLLSIVNAHLTLLVVFPALLSSQPSLHPSTLSFPCLLCVL